MILKVGDKVPAFKAKDANGKVFNSEDKIGKGWVIIYFYPKDNTAICTAQACSFRDAYQDFQDLNAEIIGISSDSVLSHQEFSNTYKLPFILLSDQDNKIKEQFGVSSQFFGLLSNRITFVVDQNGQVQVVYNSVFAKGHINKALQTIKELNSK
ncbi:peroxiredoxin [Flavobacterium faecale]|uniref:thioredoxin-dependent peroxiredoxin n=1 Tax=Flavobacterium faecale TaxID=1355330 RepID=A0A2S1LCK7_9FLAO|nr:peroxiredoxin [Flavobacterium faecale]AWG21493.1 peroxiredoxin [Flavobacterium faecale]